MAKGGYVGGVKVLVSPEIDFDMAKFATQVRKLRKTIEDVLDKIHDKNVEIDVDANVKRAKQKIEDLKDEANDEATLEVDVDAGKAKVSLAALARDRYVSIKPILDSGAFARVQSAISSLSGAGALSEATQAMKNLIRSTSTLKGLMTGIKASGLVTLGAAATHAVGGVSALVSGMGKLLPLASALPGVAAGAAAAFKGVSTVWADAAERMESLGYSFQSVNKAIGNSAWPKFGSQLQSVADRVLPRLESGMGKVGAAVGTAANEFLRMAGSSKALSGIDTILNATSEAVGRMGPGLASLGEAFLGLSTVGASFLPRMADWFNAAADGAARWVEEGMKTGSIAESINVAINAAKTLAGAIGDVLGIFGAVGRAAETAGYSLSGIAGVLDRVHEAMDSMAGQQVLVQVFQAAQAAMTAFQTAAGGVSSTVGTLASNLQGIAVPAATSLGTAFSMLATTIETMVASGGAAAYFQGIQSAMTELSPQAGNLGTILGEVATFAGTMASTMGTVLATAIETLTPVVAKLGPKFGEVAEQLGGVLVTALEAAAPLLETLADAIASIPTPVLTALAVGLTGVGAAAKGLQAFSSVATVFKSLGPIFSGIGTVVAKLSPALSMVGRAFMFVVTKINPIVAVISLVIGAFVLLWTKCEGFRNFFIGLWDGIVSAWNTALEWITSTFVPAVQDAFSGIGDFFSNLWDGVVNAFTTVWSTIQGVWDGFVGTFGPIWSQFWENIRTVVGTVFVVIKTVITTAINAVKGIISAVLAAIRGDWSGAWNNIKGVAQTIWNGIKAVIHTVIAGVVKIISNSLKTIQSVWNNIWNAIKSFVSNVWNGIKSAISNAISAVRSAISNGVNAIRNTWNNVWNSVKSFFSNTWNSIKSTCSNAINSLKSSISNGINNAINTIRQLPSRAASALGNLGSTLWNAGKSLIQGFINGIKSMIGSVASTLKGLTSKLTSWKGPESKDKRLLTPAGEYVIQGFIKGLESQYGAVRRSLQDFTKDLADDMYMNVSPTVGTDFTAVGAASGAVAAAGGAVTVNQYYPVAQDASEVRDEVSRAIRLAATV